MLEFQDLFYEVLIIIEIATIISSLKKEFEGQKLKKKNRNNQLHYYFWSSIKKKETKICLLATNLF